MPWPLIKNWHLEDTGETNANVSINSKKPAWVKQKKMAHITCKYLIYRLLCVNCYFGLNAQTGSDKVTDRLLVRAQTLTPHLLAFVIPDPPAPNRLGMESSSRWFSSSVLIWFLRYLPPPGDLCKFMDHWYTVYIKIIILNINSNTLIKLKKGNCDL